MHAALAEVAEQHGVIAVLRDQRAVVADVVAEPVRRYRGVLPPGEPGVLTGNAGVLDRAPADLPDVALPGGVLDDLRVAAGDQRCCPRDLLVRLARGVGPVLGEQPGPALG